MITLRTISESRRRFLFLAVLLADLASRVVAASFEFHHILIGSTAAVGPGMTMSTATGLAVPAMAAPLVLSPIAYILGQIFVRTEANYVRFVSAAVFFGSFLTYEVAPGLSILLAVMAYLILGSGMLRNDATSMSPDASTR